MPETSGISATAALAVGLLVAMIPAAGAGPGSAKSGVAGPSTKGARAAGGDRVSRLEKTVDDLRREIHRIGGGKTSAESIRNVQNDIHDLRDKIKRVEEAEKKSGLTLQEIEAQRKKFDDQSIVHPYDDIKSEAETESLQEAANTALSESAGKTLGWIGWGLTALDYTARKIIKESNISMMEDALKQEGVRHIELTRVAISLYKDESDLRHRLAALKELRARYDKAFEELAVAHARQRPATSHAVLTRATDTAGDKEEARKEKQYNKKHMVIEPVSGHTAPRLRPGVHRASHRSAARKNIAYSRDDGTRAADPDPSIRFQLRRDMYSHMGAGGD